ncbi:hypothetical protein EDD16DRAFT_1666641, partial [Pisolithus croceorrhizus]
MEPGALMFNKDFPLHDAMAAFEIGEPRFDSGLALLDDSASTFRSPRAALTRGSLLDHRSCIFLR